MVNAKRLLCHPRIYGVSGIQNHSCVWPYQGGRHMMSYDCMTRQCACSDCKFQILKLASLALQTAAQQVSGSSTADAITLQDRTG